MSDIQPATSIHDMGGTTGLGRAPVPERDEPVFKHRWEAWAFAIAVLSTQMSRTNLDAFRHALNRLDRADYPHPQLLRQVVDRLPGQLRSVAPEASLELEELQERGEPEPGGARLVAHQPPVVLDQRPAGDQVLRRPGCERTPAAPARARGGGYFAAGDVILSLGPKMNERLLQTAIDRHAGGLIPWKL